jgi:acyl-CoA synthetase (AMP-forming)/AMP-acid ligase II
MITTSDYLLHPKATTTLKGYTLPALFEETVAALGDAPAVFDGTRFRSWREWAYDAHALARALQELGVSKGDVVALHLPNCWEYLITHIATTLVGAVILPLHMAYGEHEMRGLLEWTGASVLVLPATYHGRSQVEVGQRLRATVATLLHLLVVGDSAQPGTLNVAEMVRQWAGSLPLPVSLTPDDPLALLASSGTTSLRPKVCIHSHNGTLSTGASIVTEGRARADDTLLSASPFTHLFGQSSIHISLWSRGRQALLTDWSTEGFLNLAQRAGVTVVFAVPAQLRDICAYLDTHPDAPRILLREIRTGGAAVPASLVDDVRRLLGAGVIVQWGMTEGGGSFTRPDDPPEVASRSVGRPITGAEVRIVGEDGRDLPTGTTGELWYRSPNIFRGYLHEPELTRATVTEDGWLRTGDLASLNEDGTITYRGRRTEFINRGGLKFSAVEVESLLSDLPQLQQFAVLAPPDARLGERSYLVATLRPGSSITLAEITEHLEARGLAKYKWPEDLIVVDALPTTPTGKIARARLAQQLASEEF